MTPNTLCDYSRRKGVRAPKGESATPACVGLPIFFLHFCATISNCDSVVDASSSGSDNNNVRPGKIKRWLGKAKGKHTYVVDGKRVKPSDNFFHTKDLDQVFIPGRHNTLKPAPVLIRKNKFKEPESLMKIKPREPVRFMKKDAKIGKKQKRRQRYAQSVKEAKERYEAKIKEKQERLRNKPRQEPIKRARKACITQKPTYPKTFINQFLIDDDFNVNVIPDGVFNKVCDYKQKLRMKRDRLKDKILLSSDDGEILACASRIDAIADKLDALTDQLDFSISPEQPEPYFNRWFDFGRRLQANSFKTLMKQKQEYEVHDYSDCSVYSFSQIKRMTMKTAKRVSELLDFEFTGWNDVDDELSQSETPTASQELVQNKKRKLSSNYKPEIRNRAAMAEILHKYTKIGLGCMLPDRWPSGKLSYAKVDQDSTEEFLVEFFEHKTDVWWHAFAMNNGLIRDIHVEGDDTENFALTDEQKAMIDCFLKTEQDAKIKEWCDLAIEKTSGIETPGIMAQMVAGVFNGEYKITSENAKLLEDYVLFFSNLYYASKHQKAMDRFASSMLALLGLYKLRNPDPVLPNVIMSITEIIGKWRDDGYVSDDSSVGSNPSLNHGFANDEIDQLLERNPTLAELFTALVNDDLPVEYMRGKSVKAQNMGGIDLTSGPLGFAYELLPKHTKKRIAFANLVFNSRGKNISVTNRSTQDNAWVPELHHSTRVDEAEVELCSGTEKMDSDFIRFFKPISDLVYSVCALICLPSAGWSFKDALHEHAKRLFFLNNFFSATDLLSLFVSGIRFVMERVFHFTNGCSTSMHTWDWHALFESKPSDQVKLFSDIMALKKGIALNDAIPGELPEDLLDESIAWAYDLDKSKDMCDSILDRLELAKKFYKFRSNKKWILETEREIHEIRTIRNSLLIKIRSGSTRPVPLCYQLYGDSRIGKSIVSTMVHEAHCHGRRLPRDKWKRWDKPVGDPYNSGFTNDTETVIMDDIGAVKEKHQKELDITTIMRFVNNAACAINQASLEDKGTKFFRGGLVILSSNNPEIGATNVMTFPQATYRRITPVNVLLREDWKLQDGTFDKVKYKEQCDIATAASKESGTRLILPNPWVFRLMKYNGQEGQFPYELDREMTTTEFLEHVHRTSRYHFIDQDSVNNSIKSAQAQLWDQFEDVGFCSYVPECLSNLGAKIRQKKDDCFNAVGKTSKVFENADKTVAMLSDMRDLAHIGTAVLAVGVSFFVLMRLFSAFKSHYPSAFEHTVSKHPEGEPVIMSAKEEKFSSEPIVAKTSGSHDYNGILAKVEKNVVKLKQLVNGQERMGSGLLIRGNIVVTAAHVLDDFDLSRPVSIMFKEGPGVSLNMDGYYIRPFKVKNISDPEGASCERDVSFGLISGGMTASRADGICAVTQRSIEARIGKNNGDTNKTYNACLVTKYNSPFAYQVNGIVQSPLSFSHKGKKQRAISIKFDKPIESGMSGSPVLFHDKYSNVYIGGVMSGRRNLDHTVGIVVPFGEDDLANAATHFDDSFAVELCSQAEDLEAENVKPLTEASIFSVFEKEGLNGGGETIGYTEIGATRNTKDDKNLIVPPYLPEVIEYYKDDPGFGLTYLGPEPWVKAMKTEMNPRGTAPPDFIRACADAFVSHSIAKIQQSSRATYLLDNLGMVSDHTAINGEAGIAYMNGSNMSSSAGFPYSGPKRNLYHGDRPYATMSDELSERVKRLVYNYENGRASGGLMKGQLKTEIRDKATFKAKKNRVFTVVPVSQVHIQKRLLMNFKRFWMSCRFLLENAMGYNADSAESGDIVDYLQQTGNAFAKTPNIIAGDFGKFDKSFDPVVFVYVFHVIEQFHKRSKMPTEELQEWQKLWRGVQEDTMHGFCTYNGGIFRRMYGLASGLYLTTEAGCIYQSITKRALFAICFYFSKKLGKSLDDDEFWTGEFLTTYAPNITWEIVHDVGFMDIFDDAMREFMRRVNLLHFGDDHSDSIIGSVLNGKLYQILYKNLFNMEYTDADKKEEVPLFNDFSEMRFLKRKFSFDDELGDYVGTLPVKSLQKMLSQRYKQNGTEMDGHKGCLESSQIEYYKFGREVYDKHLTFLKGIWQKHFPGLQVNFWTYDEQKKRFSTSNYNISQAPQSISVGGKVFVCPRWAEKTYIDYGFFDKIQPSYAEDEFELCSFTADAASASDGSSDIPVYERELRSTLGAEFIARYYEPMLNSTPRFSVGVLGHTGLIRVPGDKFDSIRLVESIEGLNESRVIIRGNDQLEGWAFDRQSRGVYVVPFTTELSSGSYSPDCTIDFSKQCSLDDCSRISKSMCCHPDVKKYFSALQYDSFVSEIMKEDEIRDLSILFLQTVFGETLSVYDKMLSIAVVLAFHRLGKRVVESVLSDYVSHGQSVEMEDFDMEFCSGVEDGGLHQVEEEVEHLVVQEVAPKEDTRKHTSLDQWDEYPITVGTYTVPKAHKMFAFYPFHALVRDRKVWSRICDFDVMRPHLTVKIEVSGNGFNGGKLFASYFPLDTFNSRVPWPGQMADEVNYPLHLQRMLEVDYLEMNLGTSSTAYLDIPLNSQTDFVNVESDFVQYGVVTVYTMGAVNASADGDNPSVMVSILIDSIEVSGRVFQARAALDRFPKESKERNTMVHPLEVDHKTFMSPVQRVNLTKYISTEGYLANPTWSQQMKSVWAFFVVPSTEKLVSKRKGEEFAGVDVYKHTYLSMFAGASKYWCGSLIYRVRVMRTNYHVGKLVCFHIPHGFPRKDKGQDIEYDYRDFHHVVVNITDSDFDIEVPYRRTEWSRTSETKSDEYYVGNGCLMIQPFMPLASPDKSSIELLVTCRAGDDFEFGIPQAPKHRAIYVQPSSLHTGASSTIYRTIGLKTSVPLFRIGPLGVKPTHNISTKLESIEQLVRMRQVVARSKTDGNVLTYSAMFIPTTGNTVTYATFMHMIGACHIAWKGALKHFVTICSNLACKTRYYATPKTLMSSESAAASSSGLDGDVISIEVPYNDPGKYTYVDQRLSPPDRDLSTVVFHGETIDIADFSVYHEMCAGDDFQFMMPVCAPYMFVTQPPLKK